MVEDTQPDLGAQGATWAERFRWLLHNKARGNMEELGRASGMSGTAAKKIVEGLTLDPGANALRSVIRTWPMINPEWLLTGRGAAEHAPSPDAAQRALLDIEARLERARSEGVELKSSQPPTGDGSSRRPVDVETEKVPGTKDRPTTDQSPGPAGTPRRG